MEPGDEITRIKDVYSTVYDHDPRDRSYVWNPLNPVSIYFRQARERAIIAALRRIPLAIEDLRILDLGCGGGSLLAFLCSIHADPAKLAGVDLMPSRVQRATAMCPSGVTLLPANAEDLPFETGGFDLACQFTMFSSILDDGVRRRVAAEVRRVLSPGGYLLWYDLTTPASATTRGIESAEVSALFPGFGVVFATRLHPRGAIRLAARSQLLCHALDALPIVPKTNQLVLLRAPVGSR